MRGAYVNLDGGFDSPAIAVHFQCGCPTQENPRNARHKRGRQRLFTPPSCLEDAYERTFVGISFKRCAAV